MDARHQVAQRAVDQAMLLDQTETREGRRCHRHLEVISPTGGIGHLDAGARKRRFDAVSYLDRIDHAGPWVHWRSTWGKPRQMPGDRYLLVQVSTSSAELSQVQVCLADG